VFEDERRFDLVVRLKDEKRKNLDDIQNLLIPTLNGSQIPLYQVAEVSIKESINQIQRENAMRRIIVGFNIHNSDVQTVVNNLQKRVEQNMKLPSGYYITYGGSFENLVAAKKRLGIAVPVSLLFIFLLLYFAFKSIRQSLLIYTAIPLSAIGGIFFLFARGLPFSISAGVGFIALFGVAVLNGIVLLAEFNRLKKDGVMDPQKRVLQGTKSRLRPVLMTALVASLGFLPMALSHGAGAEVQRPLATVVIGGLLVATFLTLFVLPVLYIQFEKIKPMKIKTTSILLSFALTIGVIGNPTATAQHRITLQQAIDTALENNFSVKNERLKAEYQKKLIASSISIPQTNVVGEYGQLNSIYTDTKFTISQSINFPTVYTKQKALQNQEWKGSVLQIALKESELKRDVTMAYAFLVYLQQKEKLLNKNDSIYTTSLEKAKLRFSKGESNILEKASAETQRGQIAMQLNQLKNDLEIMQLQFRLLLNTPSIVLPSTDQLRLDLKDIAENTGAINHPSLLILEQQKKLASVNTQLEKSKLLPDLTFGYTNMSIQGTGADNVYYPRSTRFNAFQLGLGVPLFFGSQKAKIKSSKTLQLYHEKSYEMALQNYNAEIEAAKKQYQTDLDNVKYFEEQALENAEIISKTANQQFLNGEINYLEWTMLINNAVNIENDYLNALKNLNFASANLTFLLSK
jgi:cobalt-zinc-cadmium resistance protein CzcA